MRLIDSDKISGLGLTITISERTGYILKGHARGKEEIIRRAVDVFIQTLSQAPTVDPWHYPSKGELPDRDGEYLCRYYKYDLHFSKVLFYRVEDNKWYNLVYDEEYRAPKPDAWQYIVPPEEEA